MCVTEWRNIKWNQLVLDGTESEEACMPVYTETRMWRFGRLSPIPHRQTHSQTLKDRATQLLRSRSGALVKQFNLIALCLKEFSLWNWFFISILNPKLKGLNLLIVLTVFFFDSWLWLKLRCPEWDYKSGWKWSRGGRSGPSIIPRWHRTTGDQRLTKLYSDRKGYQLLPVC